jgi:nicotinate-nucleotide adenylyltransferase
MDINNRLELAELTESVRKYALAAVSEERYKHSVRVAQTCAKLCAHYGLSEQIGFFVGIAHDICKSMNDEALLKTAALDGQEILKIESSKPALLHGRAAAVLLRDNWNVDDKDVLEAVANHTFGKAGMSDLAKLLYVADKIEPGRENVTPEYTERLMAMSVNQMTAAVVKESMDYLKSKGKKVAAETKAFYKSLKD